MRRWSPPPTMSKCTSRAGSSCGHRPEDVVDVLLGREPPDEDDPVGVARREIGRVVRLSMPQLIGMTFVKSDRLLEEVGRLARRGRHGPRHVEGALRVIPRELEDEARDRVREDAVKSTMLSAMTWLVAMIGMPRSWAIRASPRPTMMCDWMCTTSGCTLEQHAPRVVLRPERHDVAQPFVRPPAPGGQAVDRHLLTLDHLAGARAARGSCWGLRHARRGRGRPGRRRGARRSGRRR